MSSAHKKIMLRKVKNTDMTLNEALQESTKVVDEFKSTMKFSPLSWVAFSLILVGSAGVCMEGVRKKAFPPPKKHI
jgi:hypothetical protein